MNICINPQSGYARFCQLGLLGLALASSQALAELSLEQAVQQAQVNDPWLKQSQLKQQAFQQQGVAANSWKDPVMSLSVANLPVDNLSLNQEGMTQLKVGISQQLPRGESLAIASSRFTLLSEQQSQLRRDRIAKVESTVTLLWLDVFYSQRVIQLINQDKALFEQMVDLAQATYANALGKTRQQDVIYAQLELVQLDDRLVSEQQKLEVAQAKLSRWLYGYSESDYQLSFKPVDTLVSNLLPQLVFNNTVYQTEEIISALMNHPKVQALVTKQGVAAKGIEMAEQSFKPKWTLNSSFAHRRDDDFDNSRSDLFSVGVSFDLPLFTEQRQKPRLKSAIYQSESVKTEKLLLVKQMLAGVEQQLVRLQRLTERESLYQQQILPKSQQRTETSLSAYTHDDGDFSDAITASIAELNAKISALKIAVDKRKSIAQLNYFLFPEKSTTQGGL